MIDFEERRDELLEEIEEMTRRKQYKALRDILVELEPADIADLFDDLPEEMLPLLFRLLPKEQAEQQGQGLFIVQIVRQNGDIRRLHGQ